MLSPVPFVSYQTAVKAGIHRLGTEALTLVAPGPPNSLINPPSYSLGTAGTSGYTKLTP